MPIDLSKLSAAELDKLIAEAAARRSRLQPEVPREVERQEDLQVTAILDPRFWVNEAPIHGGVLVRVRHPGYGWLIFHLPHASALEFTKLLQQWNRPAAAKH